ncbi:MAG TPA: 4Fe-4S binding protein, partial [Chloroflexi bacterium]|nr:4Fe-4S binding protein [Chloroflexota bacterium]
KPEDLDELKLLAKGMQQGSLCALGQLAPSPALSTLQHFEDEYRAHIEEKRCPAGKCKALITYEIITDLCTGCTLCARNCPSNTIIGTKKEPHVIEQSACIQCGMCMEVCNFGAVIVK